MVFWLLAITIAVIVCAALYYAAAGRMVNAGEAVPTDATAAHFRLALGEIENDTATGRLGATEAIAAKAELARELLRQRGDGAARRASTPLDPALILPASIVVVAIIAFATYAVLGSPGLPSQPFASRPDEAVENIGFTKAVKTIAAHLATHPEDLKGWQVIAPIYMQDGQYPSAEAAYRQILALAPPTADSETDLAEALMMQQQGAATGEAGELLARAAALDPHHVRSRFYLAADATRRKDYPAAITQWNALIAMGGPADPWMAAARQGLATAEAGRDGKPLPGSALAPANPDAAQSPAIRNMVEGLAGRLAKNGGTLAEWTQLVRSEIVLGDLAKAQTAYDSARRAYPDAGDRAELDGLAAQAGLKLDGGGQ